MKNIISVLFILVLSNVNAANLDLGFKESNYFLKTNLSKDFASIKFGLFDTKKNQEHELTKCELETSKITDSLPNFLKVTSITELEKEKFEKDVKLLVIGSGYSQFTRMVDFAKIFKLFLESNLQADCILESTFNLMLKK